MMRSSAWVGVLWLLGQCEPNGAECADLDGSGMVNVNDLLILLSAFGTTSDGAPPPPSEAALEPWGCPWASVGSIALIGGVPVLSPPMPPLQMLAAVLQYRQGG